MEEALETQIAEWRHLVAGRPGVDAADVEELEAHLRDQIADLDAVGLSVDEAFLVAVKRMGGIDDLSRELAAENGGRLWRQLVLSGPGEERSADRRWPEALAFAAATAVAVLVVLLAAGWPDEVPDWLFRNASLLVLPFLAAYFVRRRRLTGRPVLVGAVAIVVAALVVNVYPFPTGSGTEVLAAIHLPVVLWAVVGLAYVGGLTSSRERRMDLVRFTGEWAIYYVLIALGGGVLMGLTAAILEPAGVDAERVAEWVLPLGAAGAVIVAAWLVESKQHVVENMAPVLTVIFTPLFAAMLLVAAVVYAVTGLGGAFDRELVGVFDALMVVVLGLVLYGMSAREPGRGPGWMDRIQLVAVAGALLLDVLVLATMVARVGELGFTPNRTVALGLNLVLLVNLAGTAWLSVGYLRGRAVHHRLERWQTGYLPVFVAWAAVVVVVVPPLFAFA